MKSILLTVAFINFLTLGYGQTVQDAANLFAAKQLDTALVVIKQVISNEPANADAHVMAGRILNARYDYSAAIGYLEKGRSLKPAEDYTLAWILAESGLCYYYQANYKRARESLDSCVAMNATKNATSAAQHLLLKLGLDTMYNSWTVKETRHFIFHIQDTTKIKNIQRFLSRKEAGFDSINNFFHSVLPKKIDYFIWSDTARAEKQFGRQLAFTDGSLCLTHSDPGHTVGHEMTHSISWYAVPVKKWSRLIGEGICVYFDFSFRDDLAMIKSNAKLPVNITKIWKNDSKTDDSVLYPLGGELTGKLIETFGREKFLQFFNDQSYSNAKLVFGPELDAMIQRLEASINTP